MLKNSQGKYAVGLAGLYTRHEALLRSKADLVTRFAVPHGKAPPRKSLTTVDSGALDRELDDYIRSSRSASSSNQAPRVDCGLAVRARTVDPRVPEFAGRGPTGRPTSALEVAENNLFGLDSESGGRRYRRIDLVVDSGA